MCFVVAFSLVDRKAAEDKERDDLRQQLEQQRLVAKRLQEQLDEATANTRRLEIAMKERRMSEASMADFQKLSSSEMAERAENIQRLLLVKRPASANISVSASGESSPALSTSSGNVTMHTSTSTDDMLMTSPRTGSRLHRKYER